MPLVVCTMRWVQAFFLWASLFHVQEAKLK